jgi:transcriptional regulator with XRE-family HTH domain
VTFRALLSAEFDRRRAKNPRYSMRRFARSLRTHHSTLSRLLNGGRPIQARTIDRLGRSLGLTASEIRTCVASEDAAAICRAVRRATFRPDSRWLASVCGLSIDRVNIALHALIYDGRLRMVAADRWIVLDTHGGRQDECSGSAVAVGHYRS